MEVELSGVQGFAEESGMGMIASLMMGTKRMEIPNNHCSQMNIFLWNCRGALNMYFRRRVLEMVVNYFLTIMILTKAKVSGDRAAKIAETLPFDGFFSTKTICYAGGLWLFWKEDVEVIVLSATEQEIHATIKVHNSDFSWIISPIYASPRLAERKMA